MVESKEGAGISGEVESPGSPALTDLATLLGGTVQIHGARGVFVPDGMTAPEILEGAKVLEVDHDIAPYISQIMVIDILRATRKLDQKN